MRLSEKTKKILWGIFAVVLVAVCAVWFLNDGIKHIEDTNGVDNFALQTITDENIIKQDVGALGLQKSTDIISNTVTYSSEKYTGVSEIYGTDITTNRMEFTVNHASVTEGNFKIVLVVNDEIVYEFACNELTQSHTLENVSGYVALRIAGESAKFKFDYYII